MGEGKKRKGVHLLKQCTQNPSYKNIFTGAVCNGWPQGKHGIRGTVGHIRDMTETETVVETITGDNTVPKKLFGSLCWLQCR